MKRSKKLELKSETVRQLTGTEMNQVIGGATVAGATGRNCQQGGGGSVGDGSVTSEINVNHKWNVQYGP